MFDIQDYDYDLPEELIAQVPAERRDQSRLLLVNRSEGSFSDRHFFELPSLLKPGDLLVVNNTRVLLLGRNLISWKKSLKPIPLFANPKLDDRLAQV